MSSYQITKAFSRAWQYRCATRAAARARKQLKRLAHRKARHTFRLSGTRIKPTTSLDVL